MSNKEILVTKIKDWVILDEKINNFQKQIRDLKNQKKNITSE